MTCDTFKERYTEAIFTDTELSLGGIDEPLQPFYRLGLGVQFGERLITTVNFQSVWRPIEIYSASTLIDYALQTRFVMYGLQGTWALRPLSKSKHNILTGLEISLFQKRADIETRLVSGDDWTKIASTIDTSFGGGLAITPEIKYVNRRNGLATIYLSYRHTFLINHMHIAYPAFGVGMFIHFKPTTAQ